MRVGTGASARKLGHLGQVGSVGFALWAMLLRRNYASGFKSVGLGMQLVCDGCYEGKEGVGGGLEGSFVCREGISRGPGRGKGRIGECLDGLACGMEYLWVLLRRKQWLEDLLVGRRKLPRL